MSEITKRLCPFRKVFLDTAPIIYFVEKHPEYFAAANEVFRLIDAGRIGAVTSPITLAECLVHPQLILSLTVALTAPQRKSFTNFVGLS